MNVLSNIIKEILSFDYLDIKVKNLINKINDLLKNKKVLKQINFKINEEAYNNRELVKNTWETPYLLILKIRMIHQIMTRNQLIYYQKIKTTK